MKFKKVKKIGIVAPARKISHQELEPALKIFKAWNLDIVLGEHLFGENNQFSGTDEERFQDLQNMINNPEIDAVFAARGGYGTARIVAKLNFSPLHEKFKWITGYSDITVLHNALACKGFPSLHATMPINMGDNDTDSLEHLKSFFDTGKIEPYGFKGMPLNRQGKVMAPVVGGNLSVIFSLRGTPFDLDVNGKILFIEDLDEYLYHIDRMITNFKLSGWFSKIKGLIVGGMEDMHDNTVPFGKTAREIIRSAVEEFDFPVAFVDGIGHTKRNLPLIMGAKTTLEVTGKEVLLQQEIKNEV